MALDERAFFTDKPETRQGRYQCPKCRRTGDYAIRWVRRLKKDRLPSGADEADRAKFAKLRDYLLRLDDQDRPSAGEEDVHAGFAIRDGGHRDPSLA